MQILDSRTGLYVDFRYTDACLEELRKVWEYCDHGSTERRTFVIAGGRQQIYIQCLTCGRKIGQALRADVSEPAPAADVDLEPKWLTIRKQQEDEIKHRYIDLQNVENDIFWEKYNKYLESDLWKKKRAKVMQRASGICEGCLDSPATQVHHLNYNHVFDELLFELVAVCKICHDKAHTEEA